MATREKEVLRFMMEILSVASMGSGRQVGLTEL
jgi:hypothetical protein